MTTMRLSKQICLGLLLLCFGSFLGLWAPELGHAQQNRPRMVISQPVFDFGTALQGSVLEHTFTVANKGNAPLHIRKIHPSCGCTAAVLDTDTIAPGEETSVKVSFNTTGFQGYKVKTVRLYTNDPEQTSSLLKIQGTVKADVQLDPAFIRFSDVRSGEQYSKNLTVTVEEASELKLTKIESRSEHMLVTEEDFSASGRRGKKLTVTLSEALPIGNFRSAVVVHTTSPRNPVLHIPVTARVEGDIHLSPSAISFGLVNGPLNKSVSRTAKLTNRSKQNFHVLSVKSDNPSIQTGFSPIENGRAYEIKVSLRKKSTGMIRARLKIATDHPDDAQKELYLPVYAMVGSYGADQEKK